MYIGAIVQSAIIGGRWNTAYVQFEYSCKQLYHIEKFFKINIGPKEIIINGSTTLQRFEHGNAVEI